MEPAEEPYTQNEIEQALLKLYSLGLIEMEYDENLEPRFSIKDQNKFDEFIQTYNTWIQDRIEYYENDNGSKKSSGQKGKD